MSDKKSDKWIGFGTTEQGEMVAMFAMPSGRIRDVPVTRLDMLNALQQIARQLKLSEVPHD